MITPTGSAAVEVNAQATLTFNVSAHTVTVQLLNLEMDPNSVPQLLAGIEMDLTNLASGTLTGTIATPGTQISTFFLDSSGNPVAAPTAQTTSTWQAQTNSSNSGVGYAVNTLALCEICKTAGHGPAQLIIGGPDPSLLQGIDRYTNANNGIKNNSHNPLILGSGAAYSGGAFGTLAVAATTPTWVLNVPLLQATTNVAAVRFYFGSAYDLTQEANGTLVLPEPAGATMIIGGVLVLIGLAWKRRMRRP